LNTKSTVGLIPSNMLALDDPDGLHALPVDGTLAVRGR
jgi:hypothetical protein